MVAVDKNADGVKEGSRLEIYLVGGAAAAALQCVQTIALALEATNRILSGNGATADGDERPGESVGLGREATAELIELLRTGIVDTRGAEDENINSGQRPAVRRRAVEGVERVWT